MENDYCPKCNKKALRYSDTFGRWSCNKCNSVFTKDKIFVGIDPDLNIQIKYKKDGSIKSIKPSLNMTLYDEVIDRQNKILEFEHKKREVCTWWNNLSDKEKIDIYEKKN